MTVREKLADWISGGKLTFYKNLRLSMVVRTSDYIDALCHIQNQETPKANATVKRMAKIAREALGE